MGDWRRVSYGTAPERLADLKKRYAPERLLSFPQALWFRVP
ncbi:hypothetical protein ACFYYY_26960 [Streptomyces sp. NPDC001834]